jgi:hypothetical protein
MKLEERFRPLVFTGYELGFRVDMFVNNVLEDVLPITGGQVQADWTADTMRNCSLIIPGDPRWVPSVNSDPLWPTGNVELHLFGRMDFGSTAVEDIPLGLYRVQKPRFVMGEEGKIEISIEGYDRSQTVARAKLRKTTGIPAGTDLVQFCQDLIQERLPMRITFNWPDGPITLTKNLIWDRGDDVWVRLRELWDGLGYDLYFDADGVNVLDQRSDPINNAVSFVHEVEKGKCAIVNAERLLDDEETFNHIIVVGTDKESNVEYIGERFDDDPASPTFIGSSDPLSADFGRSEFGDKLDVRTNDLVSSTLGAIIAARSELLKSLGIQEFLTIQTPWIPIEPNDINQFTIPNLKVANLYAIDAVTMSLEQTSTMSLTTRQRRTVGVAPG